MAEGEKGVRTRPGKELSGTLGLRRKKFENLNEAHLGSSRTGGGQAGPRGETKNC